MVFLTIVGGIWLLIFVSVDKGGKTKVLHEQVSRYFNMSWNDLSGFLIIQINKSTWGKLVGQSQLERTNAWPANPIGISGFFFFLFFFFQTPETKINVSCHCRLVTTRACPWYVCLLNFGLQGGSLKLPRPILHLHIGNHFSQYIFLPTSSCKQGLLWCFLN